MRQIILAGVGGQGILLASRVLANAAADAGLEVRTAETIGMAQRGGSVVTHVRIFERGQEVLSSMIPTGQADVIVAFEPGEAIRSLPLLRHGGGVVVPDIGVCPSMSSPKEVVYDVDRILSTLSELETSGRIGCLISVEASRICSECGSRKVLNTVMLGAAASAGLVGFDPQEISLALRRSVKPAFLELNERALELASA